ALLVIKGVAFCHILRQANPLAKAEMWRPYNTLRAYIITKYKSYIPAIKSALTTGDSVYPQY
ncbi:hypothetical protein BU23DRAFT_484550, partial [Bimuria novae-zelandiae CBS 107.79]